MKRFFTLIIAVLASGLLGAQEMIPQKVIKWDAYALANRSLSVALELRNAPKISWEFHFGLTQHTPNARKIFTEQTTISNYRVQETRASGWEFVPPSTKLEYLGNGRPLEVRNLTFQANYSADFRLGCMASFLSKNRKWRLLMMPSLQTSYVQYREEKADETTVGQRQVTSWIESIPGANNPNAVQLITQQVIDYEQVRRSVVGGKMLGGVAYEMGVSSYFGKKMMAEVRYRIGQNFAGLDGKENLPSALQRGFSTFTLHVGYILDKPAVKEEAKVNVKPTKNIKKKDAKKKKKSKKKKRRRH